MIDMTTELMCRHIVATEKCLGREIVSIQPMKEGMTNDSFLLQTDCGQFVVRLNGNGSEVLIDRYQEAEVYRAISQSEISDHVVCISPEAGYKVTRYIPKAHVCDKNNWYEVGQALRFLHRMHDMKFVVSYQFDIWRQINFYESLWKEKSCYGDYEQVKARVLSLREKLLSLPVRMGLAHIDSVADNFLFTDNRIYLIDWEYAAMCDQHIDLAMFCVYAGYESKEIEKVLQSYFTDGVADDIRLKIYIYIAAAGLLWSNWCEFKRMCGIHFGTYAEQQYEYASRYSDLILRDLWC